MRTVTAFTPGERPCLLIERVEAKRERQPADSRVAAELTRLIRRCEQRIASLSRASIRLACECGAPVPITERDACCVLCSRIVERPRAGRASRRRSVESALGHLRAINPPSGSVSESETRPPSERWRRVANFGDAAWASYVERAEIA